MIVFKIIKNFFTKKEMKRRAMCVNCKHFAQGDKYGFCANEKQTNSELNKYAHPSLNCNLHEPGTHQTRIDYMKNFRLWRTKSKS